MTEISLDDLNLSPDPMSESVADEALDVIAVPETDAPLFIGSEIYRGSS